MSDQIPQDNQDNNLLNPTSQGSITGGFIAQGAGALNSIAPNLAQKLAEWTNTSDQLKTILNQNPSNYATGQAVGTLGQVAIPGGAIAKGAGAIAKGAGLAKTGETLTDFGKFVAGEGKLGLPETVAPTLSTSIGRGAGQALEQQAVRSGIGLASGSQTPQESLTDLGIGTAVGGGVGALGYGLGQAVPGLINLTKGNVGVTDLDSAGKFIGGEINKDLNKTILGGIGLKSGDLKKAFNQYASIKGINKLGYSINNSENNIDDLVQILRDNNVKSPEAMENFLDDTSDKWANVSDNYLQNKTSLNTQQTINDITADPDLQAYINTKGQYGVSQDTIASDIQSMSDRVDQAKDLPSARAFLNKVINGPNDTAQQQASKIVAENLLSKVENQAFSSADPAINTSLGELKNEWRLIQPLRQFKAREVNSLNSFSTGSPTAEKEAGSNIGANMLTGGAVGGLGNQIFGGENDDPGSKIISIGAGALGGATLGKVASEQISNIINGTAAKGGFAAKNLLDFIQTNPQVKKLPADIQNSLTNALPKLAMSINDNTVHGDNLPQIAGDQTTEAQTAGGQNVDDLTQNQNVKTGKNVDTAPSSENPQNQPDYLQNEKYLTSVKTKLDQIYQNSGLNRYGISEQDWYNYAKNMTNNFDPENENTSNVLYDTSEGRESYNKQINQRKALKNVDFNGGLQNQGPVETVLRNGLNLSETGNELFGKIKPSNDLIQAAGELLGGGESGSKRAKEEIQNISRLNVSPETKKTILMEFLQRNGVNFDKITNLGLSV